MPEGKVRLIDAAYQVLMEAKGAVAAADIAEVLCRRGIFPKADKKVVHHTYTRLHRYIQEHGEDSKIKKAGRGMFCAAEHYKENEHGLVELGMVEGVHGKIAADGRPKCCGNCAFISYSGPGELTLFGGSCENRSKSGRWYVRAAQEACPEGWRPRPADKVRSDRARQQELRSIVNIENIKAARARR